MTPAQMETFRKAMNIRPGTNGTAFEGVRVPAEDNCRRFSTACHCRARANAD